MLDGNGAHRRQPMPTAAVSNIGMIVTLIRLRTFSTAAIAEPVKFRKTRPCASLAAKRDSPFSSCTT
jgi:hypothetical protein